MTSRDDLERHLFHAITGGRLGPPSHNVANAIRSLGKSGIDRPWEAVGASRETWRRWNLPKEHDLHQKPTRHAAALLKWLRRARLSKTREARLRESRITIDAYSRYEQQERTVGPVTLDWQGTDPIIDAYLDQGIGAAADAFLDAIRTEHFREWLSPDADGSSQSYDLTGLDLLRSPARGARTRARKRR